MDNTNNLGIAIANSLKSNSSLECMVNLLEMYVIVGNKIPVSLQSLTYDIELTFNSTKDIAHITVSTNTPEGVHTYTKALYC